MSMDCQYESHSLDDKLHLLLTKISGFDRLSREKYPVSWIPNRISIIVAPCSVHSQSKCLAVAAYRELISDQIDNVIVITQSECQMFHGIALPLHTHNMNLFGMFEINNAHVEQLADHQLFHYNQLAHQLTSNFDLHIECMEYYLDSSVKITPMLIGCITDENAIDIAKQISLLLNDRTLVIIGTNIAPSNMSSGCSVSSCIYSESSLYNADAFLIRAIQGIPAGDNSMNRNCLAEHNPFIVLLKLLDLPLFANIESYFVGYDLFHDRYYDRTESYASFIFQQRDQDQQGYKNYIGSYEQSQLIHIAERSLLSLFEPVVFKAPVMMSYEMMQPYGVFVSVYSMSDHGIQLRGCMGQMQTHVRLHEMVTEMTKQAASDDGRFYRLTHQECKSSLISISLVAQLREVICHSDLKSTDGIWFQYYDTSIVSLPSLVSVPLWNYQDALTNICFKADISLFAWTESKSKICVFQTVTFK